MLPSLVEQTRMKSVADSGILAKRKYLIARNQETEL